LEHCLRLFDDENYLLVDGGASIGYWSVLASENPRHAVVAVEPVGMTFEELQRNRKLNGERFECLRAALHDGTRARVQMAVDSERHGSSYVKLLSAPIDADRCLEEARVVTIDQVVAEADPASERPLILKLDVEGSEVAALQGASEALKADPLVIYEDHGTDHDARASRYVLEDLGFVGYFIDDAGRILRMRDVEHVRAVKGGRNQGFNFFASRGGSRFDRILSKYAV
jgi:FkbM family methyltransferase